MPWEAMLSVITFGWYAGYRARLQVAKDKAKDKQDAMIAARTRMARALAEEANANQDL